MKSNKAIDVNQSSLVSLKAELSRKQEEAQKAKGSESYIRPQPKKKKEVKVNPGIEERKQKDEMTQEEVDLLQKSREVLEVKSKLYDKLQKGDSVQENVGDPYLVDFKEKLDKVFSEAPSTSKEALGVPSGELSDEQIEDDYDDEGWVDYTDCLGRTRRCLKEDLEIIKKKDEETSKMLGVGATPEGETQSVEDDPETSDRHLEMISGDMERQKMREKWEKMEQTLLNKKNIYYEDIRFDEARTHGVAYYNFSTEESKREEEQAEFKRVREETAAKQKESKEIKLRRDMIKQSRLIAARNRQRARVGLPPLIPDKELEEKDEEIAVPIEPKQDVSRKDLEESLARAAHVRPWDIGKDGVKLSSKVLSQEEWVEKKRQERPAEFAPLVEDQGDIGPPVPVSFYREMVDVSSSDDIEPRPQLLGRRIPQKSNKRFKVNRYQSGNVKMGDMSSEDDTARPRQDMELPSSSRAMSGIYAASTSRGAKIPPPLNFDYYTSTSKTFGKSSVAKSTQEMIESIEAGVELLRREAEMMNKRKTNEDD